MKYMGPLYSQKTFIGRKDQWYTHGHILNATNSCNWLENTLWVCGKKQPTYETESHEY